MLNTFYTRGRGPETGSWHFHFIPLFDVGPSRIRTTIDWNILYGLIGYKRVGRNRTLKLFWLFDATLEPAPRSTTVKLVRRTDAAEQPHDVLIIFATSDGLVARTQRGKCPVGYNRRSEHREAGAQRRQRAGGDGSFRRICIVVHSPDTVMAQRTFPLTSAPTLGRSDGVPSDGQRRVPCRQRQACLQPPRASCAGAPTAPAAEVLDLDSRNGTFIDRQRITSAHAPVGAIVRVGDTFIEIAVAAPGTEVPSDLLLRGRSPALQRLLLDVARVATSDVSLLIEGETGTGKELVAGAVHALSRRAGPLVAVNCASVPAEIAESFFFGHRKGAFTGAHTNADGVFEQARDGTLFLDEIGELRRSILQAKLLCACWRTRQYSPVGSSSVLVTNARFVSATNARLRVQVAAGTFRSDLFARLAGFEIAVPPLRRRRSDIPLLWSHFFDQAAPANRSGAPSGQRDGAVARSLLAHERARSCRRCVDGWR